MKKLRKIEVSKAPVESKSFLNQDQMHALTLKTTRGIKWSKQTVKKGLQFNFACGTTGYKMLLAHHLPLPSLRTLRRRIQKIKFDSGILHQVFHYLKLKISTMAVPEKMCSLTLDEMSIKSRVEFDKSNGRFCGNVSLPLHTGITTHALVFMLGGVATRWKQTVAYYFTGDSTNGRVIKDIITEII